MSDYQKKIKYQRIGQMTIAGAAATGSIDANTDKQYKDVTGILVSITGTGANVEDGLMSSTFTKFEIDSQEVFPNGFEAKFVGVTRNTDVPANQKFYEPRDSFGNIVPLNGNNSKVNVNYTDGSFAGVSYPHTVNVWLRLENLDENMMKDENKFMRFLKSMFAKWLQSDEGKHTS